MAVIANQNFNYFNAAKALGANGIVLDSVNTMMQKNSIVGDATVIATTGVDEHTAGVITDIPFPEAVGDNDYAPVVQVSQDIIKQGTAKYEDWQEWNHETLVAKMGKAGAKTYLANQARGIVEGHAQQIAHDTIYASKEQDFKKFNGFFSQRNKLGDYVYGAGGTGSDCASGLFVAWGIRGAYALTPRNVAAGMKITKHDDRVVDRTKDTLEERAVRRSVQYVQRWGVFIHHPASVQRIANIDVSNLSGANAASIQAALTAIHYNTEGLPPGLKKCCYFNADVLKALDAQALKSVKDGGGLTYDNWEGKRVLRFRDIVIKQQTKLMSSEARITA